MKAKKAEKRPNKHIEITEIIEKRSFRLLRFLGYTLLMFSLFDYLVILIPPQLTNPNWEFQSIGQMVDHVWSILLGLTFIFLFNQSSILNVKQIKILKLLSWLSLVIGIFYLLMLPLGINNSLTLYRSINNQFKNQQAQQQAQSQRITDQLTSVASPQQLNSIAASLNIQTEPNSKQFSQDLKNKIFEQIKTSTQNAINTGNIAKREQIKNLIKTAVRINIGTIISGVCFIILWRLTNWIRTIEKKIG
jgi:signal transduction histidine kinase